MNPKGPGLRALGRVTTYAHGLSITRYLQDHRPPEGASVELRREPDKTHDRNATALPRAGARKPLAYVARRRVSLEPGPGPGRDDDSAFLVAARFSDLVALTRSP